MSEKQIISIVTLGCSKNQVDSEYLAAALNNKNFTVKHESDKADIVIINTCGFILDAKEESIDTIIYYCDAKKTGKIKKLIVFGCLIQRYKEELSLEIQDVDSWFGVRDFQEIVDYLDSDLKISNKRLLTENKHFAYLKISEGCDRSCSFCAIPSIRGTHKSVPMEDLLEQAKFLVQSGAKELIVIAQDTTYYGIDIYGKRKLAELLELLATESGAEWIRLHYTYPAGFPTDIIDVMAKHENICKYIDMPIQHVNNEILSSMKRFHTKEDIENLINEFKSKMPDIHIRTTLISGYPGETIVEHKELKEFIKKHKFARLGVFTYSNEEGTEAANIKDNVKHLTKLKRMQEILDLQEQISLENNKLKIGKTFKVIVDEVGEDYLIARTEYDSPDVDNIVNILSDNNDNIKPGMMINVKITDAEAHELFAIIVKT